MLQTSLIINKKEWPVNYYDCDYTVSCGGKGGTVKIPRCLVSEYLASNGKICLSSDMTEKKIFQKKYTLFLKMCYPNYVLCIAAEVSICKSLTIPPHTCGPLCLMLGNPKVP